MNSDGERGKERLLGGKENTVGDFNDFSRLFQ